MTIHGAGARAKADQDRLRPRARDPSRPDARRAGPPGNGRIHPPAVYWHQVRIAPVGSFIIATEPLDASVCDDLLPTRRMASDSKNLLNYFRITPDNRLLFGGRARFAMSNPQSDEKSGRLLRDAMVRTFPELANASIDYCWGGQVDMEPLPAGPRRPTRRRLLRHGVRRARSPDGYVHGAPDRRETSPASPRRTSGATSSSVASRELRTSMVPAHRRRLLQVQRPRELGVLTTIVEGGVGWCHDEDLRVTCELSRNAPLTPEVFVVHRNAPLSENRLIAAGSMCCRSSLDTATRGRRP